MSRSSIIPVNLIRTGPKILHFPQQLFGFGRTFLNFCLKSFETIRVRISIFVWARVVPRSLKRLWYYYLLSFNVIFPVWMFEVLRETLNVQLKCCFKRNVFFPNIFPIWCMKVREFFFFMKSSHITWNNNEITLTILFFLIGNFHAHIVYFFLHFVDSFLFYFVFFIWRKIEVVVEQRTNCLFVCCFYFFYSFQY